MTYTNKPDRWIEWIIVGGELPDIALNWPEVDIPEVLK